MNDEEPGSDHAIVQAGPVAAGDRFVSLDTLRGVAVLGILVMNIYFFAMPSIGYTNPLAIGGTEWHNIGTWFFTHFFFDQKFLSIFAMMFGAGLVLMSERAEQRGAKFGRIYYRRQFWLLILGALHAYFLWLGDILFVYAIIGMFVFLFRRRSPRALIIIACLLLPLSLLMGIGFSIQMEQIQVQAAEYAELQAAGEELSEEQLEVLEQWNESRVFIAPTPEDTQKDIDTHKGSYSEILAFRIPRAAQMQIGVVFMFFPRIAALMLIGMALMKLRVLTAERSVGFYRAQMLTGYLLGLPLTVYSGIDLHAHDFDGLYAFRYGAIANYFGSLIVAVGHIGLVMLVVKTGFFKRLMQRFAAVGRMALTNYLLHSVILTTVFYGYGLGLYGDIARFWQMGFVLAVVGLQLYLSPWWLIRYRFGPIEWLWRSLTYWRRQPMRVGSSD